MYILKNITLLWEWPQPSWQTCYHHPPCRPDQVCLLVTSTTSDCVSEGDEHRRGLQQTELGLMGHFPLGHESIELVQAEPGGKIEMDSGTSLCLSPAGGGGVVFGGFWLCHYRIDLIPRVKTLLNSNDCKFTDSQSSIVHNLYSVDNDWLPLYSPLGNHVILSESSFSPFPK